MFDLGIFAIYEPFLTVFKYIFLFAPLWVPIILLRVFWDIWMRYIRTWYIAEQGNILLEVVLPKEITKSPAAMELVFTALYQTGSATYLETYISGKVKPAFSFELVSIDGQVRFFIWTPPKFKNMIEAQIYAQYPNVELHEVPDYTLPVEHDPDKVIMWGTNYKLTKPDPYPIKTYVDYGLDKDPKEEYKVDPLTSMLEFLGSLKRGEQVWLQIIIQAHKKEGLREGRLFKREDWKRSAKEEVKKIKKEFEPEDSVSFPRAPTEAQKKKIDSIERSIDKFPFDCIIRGFYIAKKEAFDSSNIPGLIGSVRQYNSNELNGFKLGKFTDHSDNTKDWIKLFSFIPRLEKIMQNRRNRLEKRFLEAYKRRSFFHPPFKYYRARPFILNTEELATIYHFPGEIATTPTIRKTPSRKKEAPSNLPV